MRKLSCALLMLILAAPVAAQSGLVANASVRAEGTVRRPVTLDVTVENHGQKPQAGILVVRFTPKVSLEDRGNGQTLRDPYEVRRRIPMLAPGDKRQLQLQTPYEAANSFSGQKRPFQAVNIEPTGEVTVEFQVTVLPLR